jgi:hypothetical protein
MLQVGWSRGETENAQTMMRAQGSRFEAITTR